MEKPGETPEIQSSLQDGFSRLDETAKRVAKEASDATQAASREPETYVHRGLATLSNTGSAVAAAIRNRPFTALLVGGLAGALMGLPRRLS